MFPTSTAFLFTSALLIVTSEVTRSTSVDTPKLLGGEVYLRTSLEDVFHVGVDLMKVLAENESGPHLPLDRATVRKLTLYFQET